MASPASGVEGAFVATQETVDLTKATFLAYILPPFVCYYLMGVLVQLEGTRFQRLALLPILVWYTWRATLVDMSGGVPTKVQSNTIVVTLMCLMSTRAVMWAFARARYRRYRDRPVSDLRNPESNPDEGIYAACGNAWDLMVNARGIGWNWPRGLVVRKPALDADARVIVFVLSSAASAALHALVFDACVQAIRSLSPDTFGSVQGGSLFDHTLPPVLELVRAVLVAGLGGASAYFGLQYSYHLFAIVGIVVFRQRPSQWPPLFDAPWRATSLGELWGRRFHQLLRHTVLTLGARPIAYVCDRFGQCSMGRLGGLLGAFLVSGIIHHLELRSSGRGGHALVVVGFWLMNGVGVVLERIWRQVTGRSVGGLWGWMWTVGWLTFWGVPTVNEYAKAGRFGALSLPGRLEPSLAVVAFVRGIFVR